MVKNLHGGTGTKSLARKHQSKGGSGHVRLPESEDEQFAYVEKMLGNGMCEVFTNDNKRLIGHIRNKFRGRQKRHNTIIKGMILLIGLRTWESVAKNCDILSIYDDNDMKQIKNKPDVHIDNLLKMQLSGNFVKAKSDDMDEITFESNEKEEEIIEDIHVKPSFEIDYKEEIDLDDI